jgi:hypothetical protein
MPYFESDTEGMNTKRHRSDITCLTSTALDMPMPGTFNMRRRYHHRQPQLAQRYGVQVK